MPRIVTLLFVSLVACGSSTESPPPGEFLRSSEPRLEASSGLTEVRALTQNNLDFAVSLHRQLVQEDANANAFYSPHSISTALTMAYAGAAGETAQEMRDALHLDQDPVVLLQAFNTLDQQLESRGEGQRGADGEPFRLRVSNGLFVQNGFPILDSYLDDLARYYDAGVSVLDFMQQSEASRVAINAWVADVTEERIEELLPVGSVSSDTVVVLTNAVYFNAAWAEPFSVMATGPGDFERLDGSTLTVPLMRGQAATRYASGEGWAAAELPYAGEEVSMVLIVPDDLPAFEAEMSGESVSAVFAALTPAEVSVTLPKFEARSRFSLVRALVAMGMVRAFELADFSRMSPVGGLAISDVLHEGFVKVDEEGTEAAAATAVIIDRVSVPTSVVANRPFLFFIRDVESGAVLFVGRIVDP